MSDIGDAVFTDSLKTWVGQMLNELPAYMHEPMTDEEFDGWIGLPAGATKMKRESEEFNRIVNLYT